MTIMRTGRSDECRAAFTLLEMVLSLSIGIVLMVGLYFALDINLTATHEGRGQVDQAEVSRYILKTVQTDIKHCLRMGEPYPVPTPANANANAAATTTTTTTPTPALMDFNMGVQGDNTILHLYISKVAKSSTNYQPGAGLAQAAATDGSQDSDLRRVTYWLVGSSGNGGLGRQEVQLVTSEDALNDLPPDVVDPEKMIIADQVIAVFFQYFDGANWQDSWDGTLPGPDMVTPIGPPRSIAVEVYVARKGATDVHIDDPSVRRYRHEIAVPTANFNNSANPTGGMVP